MGLEKEVEEIKETIRKNIGSYKYFLKRLIMEFNENPAFKPYIHSIRHRVKDEDHLIEKVKRKNQGVTSEEDLIVADNLCQKITDLIGIRILHLHLGQFQHIHLGIMKYIEDGEFYLFEQPKAYTWDIESKSFFENLGINTFVKESYYTSIHYVLKPSESSLVTCEIQVRTLLEEVWGEVDHALNYPNKHENEHCQSQLKVLARIIGASAHLSDSIMRQYQYMNDHYHS